MITFFAFFATVPSPFSSPTRFDDEKNASAEIPANASVCALKLFKVLGFGILELPEVASVQSAELNLAYRRAFEKNNVAVYAFKHSSHLAIPALGNDHLDSGNVVFRADKPYLAFHGFYAVKHNARTELVKLRFAHLALHLGDVGFADFVSRVHKPVRKVAVGSEKE